MDETATTRQRQTPAYRRELLLTIGGTIAALAVTIGIFMVILNASGDPISQKVRSQADFPLYWVSYFPSGFKPSAQGYNLQGKAIQLVIANSAHQTITIDQLAAPSGYNPLAEYDQTISPLTTSPLGIIYNLTLKASYHYAVNTGHTMILIGSNNTVVTQATAKLIADGLKPAN